MEKHNPNYKNEYNYYKNSSSKYNLSYILWFIITKIFKFIFNIFIFVVWYIFVSTIITYILNKASNKLDLNFFDSKEEYFKQIFLKDCESYDDIFKLDNEKFILSHEIDSFIKKGKERACLNYKKFNNKISDNQLDIKNTHTRNNLGVMLCGMPGLGKSLLIRATYKYAFIQSNIDCDISEKNEGVVLIKVNANNLFSKYVGGTSKRISKLFDQIEQLESQGLYVLVQLDECESVFQNRNSDKMNSIGNVQSFLNHLDNLIGKNVLFLCSTNYINVIDDAIIRTGRIGKIIELTQYYVDDYFKKTFFNLENKNCNSLIKTYKNNFLNKECFTKDKEILVKFFNFLFSNSFIENPIKCRSFCEDINCLNHPESVKDFIHRAIELILINNNMYKNIDIEDNDTSCFSEIDKNVFYKKINSVKIHESAHAAAAILLNHNILSIFTDVDNGFVISDTRGYEACKQIDSLILAIMGGLFENYYERKHEDNSKNIVFIPATQSSDNTLIYKSISLILEGIHHPNHYKNYYDKNFHKDVTILLSKIRPLFDKEFLSEFEWLVEILKNNLLIKNQINLVTFYEVEKLLNQLQSDKKKLEKLNKLKMKINIIHKNILDIIANYQIYKADINNSNEQEQSQSKNK